ncbi:MAG: MCE family protein [Acetobacteraceae bacterium]|nr:MCE family protein [Acetobacteraceae bacterium]MBV8592185.1 MCE family protein [Acetobacteraceae bacterium]
MQLRHTDQWIGLFVILGVVLFVAAILQAGVVRDLFHPVSRLRIILPETGVGGLSVGADVEVLGTQAGTVRRIVIDPRQQIYAEADIDDQARAFIRRDSQAVIRRRYGVAGAAYLDIKRGTGTPLDWTYAVIEATTERAPTETVGAVIDEVREKIFPILDDAGHSMHTLAALMDRMAHGEGDIGRLLTDDALMRGAEQTLAHAQNATAALDGVMAQLQGAAHDARALAQSASSRESGVPALLRRTDQLLANLQAVTRDLAKASPRTPQIARNLENSSASLPSLIIQTQQTAQELEALLTQLRGLWLLGGGGPPKAEPRRLPVGEVRP